MIYIAPANTLLLSASQVKFDAQHVRLSWLGHLELKPRERTKDKGATGSVMSM
ncbi:hypothetical protein COLO4_19382 [Corchorus olitorius]|uniref:Uncharacterized protein n=1 Tax=Corchorus olitorius TaxID=93759 RepID=A0A1R3J5P4_9ROSI|nr:hypothetical protein COLO4_19382 [Corchorus olitorius]